MKNEVTYSGKRNTLVLKGDRVKREGMFGSWSEKKVMPSIKEEQRKINSQNDR